jgi:hypothetical protein
LKGFLGNWFSLLLLLCETRSLFIRIPKSDLSCLLLLTLLLLPTYRFHAPNWEKAAFKFFAMVACSLQKPGI